jgi:hypothetical protein
MQGTNLVQLITEGSPITDNGQVKETLENKKGKVSDPALSSAIDQLLALDSSIGAARDSNGQEPDYVQNSSHLSLLKSLSAAYKGKRRNLYTPLTKFNRNRITAGLSVIAMIGLMLVFYVAPRARKYQNQYSNFELVSWQQGFGRLTRNRNLEGGKLSVAGKTFSKGIATHAVSKIKIRFDRGYKTFKGLCGVDDVVKNCGSTVKFTIKSGENVLFETPVMKSRAPAIPFSVPVTGLDSLELLVGNAGDGVSCDHADWLELKLE